MTRIIDDEVLPNPYVELLTPGIRKILSRYSAVRDVAVFRAPTLDSNDIFVRYTLITDETRTIRIPARLFEEDRYAEIVALITQYLGVLP